MFIFIGLRQGSVVVQLSPVCFSPFAEEDLVVFQFSMSSLWTHGKQNTFGRTSRISGQRSRWDRLGSDGLGSGPKKPETWLRPMGVVFFWASRLFQKEKQPFWAKFWRFSDFETIPIGLGVQRACEVRTLRLQVAGACCGIDFMARLEVVKKPPSVAAVQKRSQKGMSLNDSVIQRASE